MQPVEVTARFDANGQLIPLQVVQAGRAWRIESIGRRWEDASGRHILVMLPGSRTVELVYNPGELRWYLRTIPGNQPPV